MPGCPLSTDCPRRAHSSRRHTHSPLEFPASSSRPCWSRFCLPARFCGRFCSSGPRPPVRTAKGKGQAPSLKEPPQAPAWPPHPPPGPGSPRGQAHCCFHGDACTLTSAFLHPWPNKEGFQVETSSLQPPLLPCPLWPLPPMRGGKWGPSLQPRTSPGPVVEGGASPSPSPTWQSLPSPDHSPGLKWPFPAPPQLPPRPRTASVPWGSPRSQQTASQGPQVTWAAPLVSREMDVQTGTC